MRCMCANNNGISSTRSVSIFSVSFMLGVYYNFEIPSRNGRTVRYSGNKDKKSYWSFIDWSPNNTYSVWKRTTDSDTQVLNIVTGEHIANIASWQNDTD